MRKNGAIENLLFFILPWSYGKQILQVKLMLVFILLFNIGASSASTIMGEQCDWTGSGLVTASEKDEIQGITPVYLRCYQGRVSWVYPRGALRVLLRLGSTGKDFQGCIKANPSFSGARIFLEGKGSLKHLYSPNDNIPIKQERCFTSREGQIALYVEAFTPEGSGNLFPKYFAEFSYDLEPLPKRSVYDDTEECRPCNIDELMRAYCTSDFVAVGCIVGIENEDNLKMSQVKTKITKFIRNSYNSDDDLSIEKNEIYSDNTNLPIVTLTVPKKCQPKPGNGDFIFMARRKLGDFSLTCAPRLEDWAILVWDESNRGNSHCVLGF